MHSLLLCSMLLLAQADAPQPAPGSGTAVEAFKAEAAAYAVHLQSRPGEKLTLVKEPVLRWGNPARTGEDGAVFVWTLGGRPEIIGSIFTYRFKEKINRKHEFHSLATEPLSAEFRGKEVWAPKKAGLTFAPIEGAPAPADSARLRLTQMKALARDFSASLKDAEGESYQLRLLTQPLYRYEPVERGVLDGAIFSFAVGTDPEVLLALEARKVKDAMQWEYALARFHYVEMKAFYKDREVFRADALPKIDNLDLGSTEYRDGVYTTYHVERNIPVGP
jgi:hypothetical protein